MGADKGRWRRAFEGWLGLRRFNALPEHERRIVFYSEGAAYWVHLGPLIEHLTRDHGRTVCYVSSSASDPGLAWDDEKLRPFMIGSGMARTVMFRTLEAGVLVMTMPDLDRFYMKRSPHPVHYVYVHHSLASTHMIYRTGAFDHFDTIFCAGPHHVAETRATERLYGLRAKNLFEHGYGRLDAIMRERRTGDALSPPGTRRRILVAPSWGRHGLLESVGPELVAALLAGGHDVTVRPHPQTEKLWPAAIDELRRRFQDRPGFALETDMVSQASFHAADVMVSDWSGAAFEFAFGLERPVLFVDVPRKVNNPEYERLNLVPLEASARGDVGSVLALDRLTEAPALIERLAAERPAMAERIRATRSRWVFNVGQSGAAGAREIVRIAETLGR